MRWELTWGPHLKALRARAKKTGVKPAALLSRPTLQYRDQEYLEAFRILDASRTTGYSAPNPIAVSEILATCALLGIASSSQRSKYLRIIQMLDRAFFAHWSEKQPGA